VLGFNFFFGFAIVKATLARYRACGFKFDQALVLMGALVQHECALVADLFASLLGADKGRIGM
jgi:hypothetical protein